MDNCCNTDSSVAAGVGVQLHDGRVNSHLAGDCHYCCDNRLHSRATRVVKQSFIPLKLRKHAITGITKDGKEV